MSSASFMTDKSRNIAKVYYSQNINIYKLQSTSTISMLCKTNWNQVYAVEKHPVMCIVVIFQILTTTGDAINGISKSLLAITPFQLSVRDNFNISAMPYKNLISFSKKNTQ